jgi:hypothetical protein
MRIDEIQESIERMEKNPVLATAEKVIYIRVLWEIALHLARIAHQLSVMNENE